ncbi:MAG: amidohydrolase family protein [Sedimentisphaerales bacterium]
MKNQIIDFHVHAFPDNIAAGAMKKLMAEAPGVKAYLNGTVSDLLKSMEQNGIEKSILCSIATRPEQFEPILRWSKKIQSEKLIVFPSIHPAESKIKEQLAIIKAEGFRGVKMHPYYQDFRLDEDRMLAIYEELIRNDLMLVVHTGYDIAFPNDDRADSHKILKVTEMFPQLKFVATHLGAWKQWDEVEKILAGKHIYMETSWSLECISPEQARRIILKHPADCVLFGTDSPWTDQGKSIELLKALKLPQDMERRILVANAESLLWPQQKP